MPASFSPPASRATTLPFGSGVAQPRLVVSQAPGRIWQWPSLQPAFSWPLALGMTRALRVSSLLFALFQVPLRAPPMVSQKDQAVSEPSDSLSGTHGVSEPLSERPCDHRSAPRSQGASATRRPTSPRSPAASTAMTTKRPRSLASSSCRVLPRRSMLGSDRESAPMAQGPLIET